MEKAKSNECLKGSCTDRCQNIVKCCFDYEKIRAESDIRMSIRHATGLDNFMTGNIILK